MAIGRVFPNEVARVLYLPGGSVGREVRALALQIARNASILASAKLGKNPNDRPRTGRYQNAFQVRVAGRTTTFQVINNMKYAAALEKGGRPHAIRARRVQYLTFKDRQGNWRRLKLVRHPGNAAYRILETAAITAMRQRYGNTRVV